MQHGDSNEGGDGLRKTREYLDMCFHKWGAVYDERHQLAYLDDEARLRDEEAPTLAIMLRRVCINWEYDPIGESPVPHSEEGEMLFAEIEKGLLTPHAQLIAKMRLIVGIDLLLWHIFKNKARVRDWVQTSNTHPLFGGLAPIVLIANRRKSFAKLVYDYLHNIQQ